MQSPNPRPFVVGLQLIGMLLWPAAQVGAETLSGRLNGHDCAERGTSCPVDRRDPHVALEADFVLQQANGEYFFLVNLPRDVKVRHVMEVVEVSGELNRKYNAVTVDEFRVDGKVVWSQALAEEEAARHLFPGALTGY